MFARTFTLVTLLFLYTNAQAQMRIIPHVTSPTGGFHASLILENATDFAQGYFLDGYDANGRLTSTATGEVPANTTQEMSRLELFGDDDATMIFIGSNTGVRVTLHLMNTTSGLSSFFPESNQQPMSWWLALGDQSAIFDGLVIVNPHDQQGSVTISKVGAIGSREDLVLKVAAGAKFLGVVSGLFSAITTGDHLEIRSDLSMAVAGLRGDSNGTFLAENPSVPLTPLAFGGVPQHLTRVVSDDPDYATILRITNLNQFEGNYQLSGYDDDGNLLALVDRALGAGLTATLDPISFFGTDQVTHLIANVNPGLAVSADQTLAGSVLMHQHSITDSRSSWRFYRGGEEWFDIVNSGNYPVDVRYQIFALDDGALLADELAVDQLPPNGHASLAPTASTDTFMHFYATSPVLMSSMSVAPDPPSEGFIWSNPSLTEGLACPTSIFLPRWGEHVSVLELLGLYANCP